MKLSVVVVDEGNPAQLERCLAALRTLPEWPEMECVTVRKGIRTIAAARAEGLQRTCGDIVAFLNSRYLVSSRWASAIAEAHSAFEAEVIGGCVKPGTQFTLVEQSIYLWEYGHTDCALAGGPLERSEALSLPGGNTSYKRTCLSAAQMARQYWELDVHASLWAQGSAFRREPGMTVTLQPPLFRPYLKERFALSREWARARARQMPRLLRLLRTFACLALPPFLVWRARRKLRSSPLCFACFPLFAVVETAGEIVGWL